MGIVVIDDHVPADRVPDYGQRGARAAGLAATGPEDADPALAAMLLVWSSISMRIVLSSSSFSASRGETSRSFSAACCSASICFPNWAYLACLRRKTS